MKRKSRTNNKICIPSVMYRFGVTSSSLYGTRLGANRPTLSLSLSQCKIIIKKEEKSKMREFEFKLPLDWHRTLPILCMWYFGIYFLKRVTLRVHIVQNFRRSFFSSCYFAIFLPFPTSALVFFSSSVCYWIECCLWRPANSLIMHCACWSKGIGRSDAMHVWQTKVM